MKEIEIQLTDFAIEPREIRVPAHEPIRLLVMNYGSTEHQFVVDEVCSIQIDSLQPGQTKALEHVFTVPGSFKTACDYAPGDGQDTSGWLVVEG